MFSGSCTTRASISPLASASTSSGELSNPTTFNLPVRLFFCSATISPSDAVWFDAKMPSASRIFYLWGLITDADNSQTEGVLATYRSQLQARSLSSAGPPPYAHCP